MKELVYSEILTRSWNSVKSQLALFAALSAVGCVGIWVVGMIPILGYFLVGPLAVGYVKCLFLMKKGETIGFSDFFWGFLDMNRFLHALIMNALVSAGYLIGFLLLIIPGIWFFVASTFSSALFVTWKQDGVSAIQKSMALVKGRWWNIFGFVFVIFLLNVFGALFFLVGLLVTAPVTAVALLEACEELLSESDPINETVAEFKDIQVAPTTDTSSNPS